MTSTGPRSATTATTASSSSVSLALTWSSLAAMYAAQAQAHWSRWRPGELQAITDPAAFFTDLGQQAAQQIEQLADSLAGQDPPGEDYLAKLGRLRMAQFTAQTQVLRELLLPEPEPERVSSGPDQDGTAIERDWLPTVLHPQHPRYHELDDDPGLARRHRRPRPLSSEP